MYKLLRIKNILIPYKVDKASEEYKKLITIVQEKGSAIIQLKTSDETFNVDEKFE